MRLDLLFYWVNWDHMDSSHLLWVIGKNCVEYLETWLILVTSDILGFILEGFRFNFDSFRVVLLLIWSHLEWIETWFAETSLETDLRLVHTSTSLWLTLSLWMSLIQVQGMSSLAAMLILNMDEVEAFISFSNLLNRPCQLAFCRVDHHLVHTCLPSLYLWSPSLPWFILKPFCLSVDAQVFCSLPGVFWRDSSSSFPSLSVFRSGSWSLPHGLVSLIMTTDWYSWLQGSCQKLLA